MNNQQEANYFYKTIKNRILNTDIEKNFQSIISNGYVINEKQFELLGNIAYMYGIEFTTQRDVLNKKVMENWILRMKDFNLTEKLLLDFEDIVKNVKVENFESTKDKLKNLILKNVKFTDSNLHLVKTNINTILRESTFSVIYSVDIDELLKTKIFTYGQISKINKIIYENININGKTFKNLRNLFSIEEYTKALNKGSEYFDSQKFAFVYFDSVLTLREWFENKNESTSIYLNLLETTPEKIDDLDIKSPVLEFPEIKNVSENLTKEEIKKESPNNTDIFLRGVLIENNNKQILNVDDLIQGFQDVIENEDLIQSVYKYIKSNLSKNRTKFEDVFGFDKQEFINKLNFLYADKSEKYKIIVNKYVSEIETTKLDKIVNYINDTITSLSIDDAQKKSYLFQQLNENQIFTFKQLQQIIGLIEQCDIHGTEINSYISLRDYLENNIDFKEIFDSVGDIDTLQVEISFYKAITDFYSVEILDNYVEIEEPENEILLKTEN